MILKKRTKEERMRDEILIHLAKNKRNLESEYILVQEKKSQLSFSLRQHVCKMWENKSTEAEA